MARPLNPKKSSCDYVIIFTTNSDDWTFEYFDTLADAREYAYSLIDKHKDNSEFSFYVKSMNVVDTETFLNRSITPEELRQTMKPYPRNRKAE